MSLYSDDEICGGCRFASFHSCGSCLRTCGASAQHNRDRVTGKCSSRQDAKHPEDVDQNWLERHGKGENDGWDDMRHVLPEDPPPGRPYMDD